LPCAAAGRVAIGSAARPGTASGRRRLRAGLVGGGGIARGLSMTGFTRTADFEQFGDHRSLVLRWQPSSPVRAQAVFFPAFGDEMNQSRRMVRLAAEALAMRGIESCVFDLLGTGDSSADFSEATVSAWRADCRHVLERFVGRPGPPLVLIGCRLGTALAVQA